MKDVPGRNGGTIKRREKGDPPTPGSGRPVGSRSFKTLLQEALARTTKDTDGNVVELKEAGALQIVAILLSKETDDNTKLKAFQIIRDTLGEAPPTKNEFTGKDGAPVQLDINTAALTVEDKRKMLELMEKAKTNE